MTFQPRLSNDRHNATQSGGLMRRTATQLGRRLSRFRKDETGVMAVEAAVIAPMLAAAVLSSFAFFDGFRASGVNMKAAYTVSDMISRETDFINDEYLDGALGLFNFLSKSQDSAKMRVTVVRWDGNNNIYKLDWSKVRGGPAALSNTDVRNMADKLPVMVHNERMILVETWTTYDSFKEVFPQQEFYHYVFTRPRFAPQVVWSDDA
ncbi:MAG: TadE/TadG family type IV pilus assembly protein [Paracoccaceae bacterium]